MIDAPLVSIIMPIRNEEKFIEKSLQRIALQDYPHGKMEVLIADGRSLDATRRRIEAFHEAHADIGVTILDNPGQTAATGFNLAVRRSRGKVIVRVDGHTEIAADYVRRCVELLQSSGAANVGGRMDPIGMGAFGEAVALATTSPFGIGNSRFHYSAKEEWTDTVYMGAWPREVFGLEGRSDQANDQDREQDTRAEIGRVPVVGLFDEELVRDQDCEFNYRLRHHGGRILLSPTIRSIYTNRSTPHALWSQYFQYGFWKIRVLQKHPRQMRWRQFVPAMFIVTLAVSLMAFTRLQGRIVFGAALGSYLVANLAASVWTSRRGRVQHVFLLAMVYAILHLSYGLGFLVGLFRFAGRWTRRAADDVPRLGASSSVRSEEPNPSWSE